MHAQTTLTRPSDREMLISRRFNAPRELVWKAWTTPEMLNQWWGPVGFSTRSKKMDLRAGGSWTLVMTGPDGKEFDNETTYIEVKAPEKLIYRHGSKTDTSVGFQTTVTFEEAGGQTQLHMRMQFPTPEALEYVIKNYHADNGAVQTIDRLGTLLGG